MLLKYVAVTFNNLLHANDNFFENNFCLSSAECQRKFPYLVPDKQQLWNGT